MRIVLTTWGSFGDLHPFLAVGIGLRGRGHEVVLATCPLYRDKVEAEGLAFAPLRPDMPPPETARALTTRLMDARTGSREVLAGTVVPALRDTEADLDAACRDADLIVAHPIVLPTPLVAHARRIPWIAASLQPILFLSAHDPSVPPGVPAMVGRPQPPPFLLAPMLRLVKRRLRPWVAPVDALRAERGLPPGAHPLFDAPFEGAGTLALFSPLLGAPQPDWPARTVQTGFPFYDRLAGGEEPVLDPAVDAFLERGEPPILFTLGTSAVLDPGAFFDAGIAAARRLGRRAILLVGRHPDSRRNPADLPDGIAAFPYAPYSLLMPRCAAVVHQGGVGTTGQALRAGRPQVVVPYSHDQPDHAHRVLRLGIGTHLTRGAVRAETMERALRRVLDDPEVARRAAAVGAAVAAEDGVGAACDAIERMAKENRPGA